MSAEPEPPEIEENKEVSPQTTVPEEPPQPAAKSSWPTGSYYYDDATGYELYDPAQENDD